MYNGLKEKRDFSAKMAEDAENMIREAARVGYSSPALDQVKRQLVGWKESVDVLDSVLNVPGVQIGRLIEATAKIIDIERKYFS